MPNRAVADVAGPTRPSPSKTPGIPSRRDHCDKRPHRSHLRMLLIAVVLVVVVFTVLHYDVGRLDLAFDLTACIVVSAAAMTARGRARLIALVCVAASCLAAWGVFAVFGRS